MNAINPAKMAPLARCLCFVIGFFSRGDAGLLQPVVRSIMDWDEYMLCADYPSYIQCQERAGLAFKDTERWTRMSIFNVARMGKFSSDRAIKEYCKDIWRVEPVPVDLYRPETGEGQLSPQSKPVRLS